MYEHHDNQPKDPEALINQIDVFDADVLNKELVADQLGTLIGVAINNIASAKAMAVLESEGLLDTASVDEAAIEAAGRKEIARHIDDLIVAKTQAAVSGYKATVARRDLFN